MKQNVISRVRWIRSTMARMGDPDSQMFNRRQEQAVAVILHERLGKVCGDVVNGPAVVEDGISQRDRCHSAAGCAGLLRDDVLIRGPAQVGAQHVAANRKHAAGGQMDQKQRPTGQQDGPVVRGARLVPERLFQAAHAGPGTKAGKNGSDTMPARRRSRFSGTLRSTGWKVLRPSVERSQFGRLARPVRSGPAAPCPDRGAVASLYFRPGQTF